MDLEKFVLRPLQKEPVSYLPGKLPSVVSTRFCKGEFVQGPLPLAWLGPAAKLPGKALHVALAICFEQGRRKRPEFRLTSAILGRFGVGRKAAYAGLAALEEAGLVTVQRRQGKNPVIRLLNTGSQPPEGSAM